MDHFNEFLGGFVLYMRTFRIQLFRWDLGKDIKEDTKLLTVSPEGTEGEEKLEYDYGVMKTNSELAAQAAFGSDRTILVRPTYMIGPADRTNRFAYWPVRLKRGGQVMVPGKANDAVQYIDVRDVAEFMIRLIEQRAAGTYNGSGPGFAMTTNAFVHGIHASYTSPVKYIQIDDLDFLKENSIIGIQPWVVQLPEYAGMSQSDNTRAINADLQFRPLSETVQATKEWWYSDAVPQERRDQILTNERSLMVREEEILEKWMAIRG